MHHGVVVSDRRNVPSKYGSNICRRVPEKPSKCNTAHGMLMNLQGSVATTLYSGHEVRHRDEIVSKTGAGLFVNGGNPIYYTSKGNADDVSRKVQAVLRGNLNDLAGHHIVLKVSEESWSGIKYMRVDRTPLLASKFLTDTSSVDPASHIYAEAKASVATTWGNLDGWLYNLPGRMRAEQTSDRVDKLHPKHVEGVNSVGGTRKWSCPLLRFSFWSKVTREFSPLLPSPARTVRIFGNQQRNMLHGTRSHPTQFFASLYDKLANVITSNGFCYCVDWIDCMVARESTVDKDCTLLETIRSMYDSKFRTIKLLTKNDQVCTQQLDWPFVGGTMRDGSASPPRFSASQVPTETEQNTCNVLDRLPPFQYR
jgi:hypothetical protein